LTLSPKTLTLLVLIALGVDALVLLILASTAGRRRPRTTATSIVKDEVLQGVLEAHARTMQRLDSATRQLAGQDTQLVESISGAVQRIGLVRYDAFEDVGGRLSFSCALLDARGDGVVITSINGRQDTRVYAKPVRGGTSDYNLSEEEEEVIREALSAPRQAVEAG